MKTRTLLCLALTTSALCACQSVPRKYDGVLGYKVESRTDTGIIISYTDAENKSDKKMNSGLLAACAKELSSPAENIRLDLKGETKFTQQVNMSVPIPVGATPNTGGSSVGKAASPIGAMYATTIKESVYREMPLRKVSADCRVSG